MKVDFDKFPDGLAPVIVQDAETNKVLMLGYANAEAFDKTQTEGRVTFFSRSRQKLWTKGETSGNFLYVKEILLDCDSDAILIKAKPAGAVCHTGADTCFNEKNEAESFLPKLEEIIKARKLHPEEKSYTSKLFEKGIKKISQKVGEEAVELILEAENGADEDFLNESADFVYHFLVLLAAKNLSLSDISEILRQRHK